MGGWCLCCVLWLFVFYECASDLKVKLFFISRQPYVHLFFVCKNCKCALFWKECVVYLFNHMWFIDLFLCVFFGSCFCVCVLCLQSSMGHLLFPLCVLFVYCASFVYCVRWMCHLAYLWLVFYAFRLLLSSSRMWVKGGWCFMPLDYCCQVQGCESKGVKDRTSWSKMGVAKNPQNWQNIFILMFQYSK